jgi:hypothetical protein
LGSGAVLELPYSFQPTSAGTIQIQRNFSNLSNLAFLYLLAGGGLPMGFGNVQDHIQQVTGNPIENYLGAGMEDLAMDETDFGGYDVPDLGATVDAATADMGRFDDGNVGGPLGMGGLVPAVDVPPGDVDGGWDGGYAGFSDGGNDIGGGGLWDGGQVDRGENMMLGDAEGDYGGGDVDCSCLGDILGGLMENLDDS